MTLSYVWHVRFPINRNFQFAGTTKPQRGDRCIKHWFISKESAKCKEKPSFFQPPCEGGKDNPDLSGFVSGGKLGFFALFLNMSLYFYQ